jgi:hypothetical protein
MVISTAVLGEKNALSKWRWSEELIIEEVDESLVLKLCSICSVEGS